MYFQWAAWEARKHLRAGVTCSVTCHWCHLQWHVEVLKMCLIQSVFQWPWRWASLFLSQSFSDKWLTTAVAPYGNFRLLNCLTTDTINIQILAVELEKKKKRKKQLWWVWKSYHLSLQTSSLTGSSYRKYHKCVAYPSPASGSCLLSQMYLTDNIWRCRPWFRWKKKEILWLIMNPGKFSEVTL